ncbi:MAG TPA: type II secretion system protein [Phycisphaerae bacterium]|jgi:prepilin-type N-terminal cleavage/methylation domain-containing protein/prepilin-type processing-associated H-X9-DG protein
MNQHIPRSCRCLRRAFTLIEILVVVAIVGILVAILLPSLSSAKERANAAKCLSNLHHLAEAAGGYTIDFAGSYPIAQDGKNNWDITSIFDPSIGKSVSTGGILYRFDSTTLKIFMCPDYVIASDPSALFTGYNYNTSFIGHGVGEAIVAPATLLQVTHPTTTALFGDGQQSGPDKFMRAPAMCNPLVDGGDAVGENTRAAGTQGYRHLGRTNVAWADGHTEAWSSCTTQTSPSNLPTAPKTGFLSADNSLYGIR